MAKRKNKIYWFEGVTEKGVRSLLTNEDSKFRWLRSQRNRRLIVVIVAIGISLISMGSYWTSIKAALEISSDTGFIILLIVAMFVIFAVLVATLFFELASAESQKPQTSCWMSAK